MPLLFSLGQHRALTAIQDLLMEGERLFAFLDDMYVICKPERVADVHNILERCLFHHARIHVHHGKTKCGTGGDPLGGRADSSFTVGRPRSCRLARRPIFGDQGTRVQSSRSTNWPS